MLFLFNILNLESIMEQALATALVIIALGISQPAIAQKTVSADKKSAEKSQSLDKRYANCLGNADCSIQERLELITALGNHQREIQQDMDRNCLVLGYNECIGPQLDERAEWHKTHKHMANLMQSLEDRSTGGMMNYSKNASQDKSSLDKKAEEMSKQEPAAGVPRPPKDYTEPQNKDEKRPWWKFLSE